MHTRTHTHTDTHLLRICLNPPSVSRTNEGNFQSDKQLLQLFKISVLLWKRTFKPRAGRQSHQHAATPLAQAVQGPVLKVKHGTALWRRLQTTFMTWPRSKQATETTEHKNAHPHTYTYTHTSTGYTLLNTPYASPILTPSVVIFTETCLRWRWKLWQQKSRGPCLVLDPQPLGEKKKGRSQKPMKTYLPGNCLLKRLL